MGIRLTLTAVALACALPAASTALLHRDRPPTAAVAATDHARAKPKAKRRPKRPAAVRPALPNDPLWQASWGLRTLGAPAIWQLGQGSPRVVVAVVDTGVDAAQPDLAGALVPGWNVLDGTTDTTDGLGHGTAVAGVIAARADDGIGGAGICPRCSVMPVKVFDATGHGPGSEIAAGIDWAVDHGANVINLSLVLNGPDDAVSTAVANAVAHGDLVVAAAGNDGGTSPNYPAALPGVISVAGEDPTTQLYAWSTGGSWVSVAAPGCNETATGGGYGEFCGTSSATAAVSGLLGLALSDGSSPAAARSALLSTAAHTGSVPVVDATAFLAAAVPAAAR